MDARTTPPLTQCQQGSLDRARGILAQEHGHDAASLAYRLGQLEWHLGQLLALVDQLAGTGTS